MQTSTNSELFLWFICLATEIHKGLFFMHSIVSIRDLSKSVSCESGLLAGVDSIEFEVTLTLSNQSNAQPFILEAESQQKKLTFVVCSLSYETMTSCEPKTTQECSCKIFTNTTYILTVKKLALKDLSQTIIKTSNSQNFQIPEIFGEELATLQINQKSVSFTNCHVNLESNYEFQFEFCTKNLNAPTLQVKVGNWSSSDTKDDCVRNARKLAIGETSAQFKYHDLCKRGKTLVCTVTVTGATTSSHVTPCRNCESGSKTILMIWITLIGLGLVVVILVIYFLFKGCRGSRAADASSFDKSSAMEMSSFQAVRLAKSKSGIDIAIKE
ncbi:hypothetical protein Bpfe_005682 [Biomphalaria pfeifferi]|uniref:Uncharacterized protein n=1 Tax=Biomphalaria pfeifferi TaxID=112525 RepID=A0AAD8C468_BIOPF|nr:hypothetical protein Bpfe_005682 [Biomphalaria pfeifferi]